MAQKQEGNSALFVVLGLLILLVTIGALKMVAQKHSQTSNPSSSSQTGQLNNYPYYSSDQATALGLVDTNSWQKAPLKNAWYTYSMPSDWSFSDTLGPSKHSPGGNLIALDDSSITSPDGNKQADYSFSNQPTGAQIDVNVQYLSSGDFHKVNDCATDLSYRLLASSKGLDSGPQCLVVLRNNQYGYIFNVGNNNVNITLTYGLNDNDTNHLTALKTLVGIAQTFKVTANP